MKGTKRGVKKRQGAVRDRLRLDPDGIPGFKKEGIILKSEVVLGVGWEVKRGEEV